MAEQTHLAVCVRNSGYEASLELRKLYEVIPDPDAETDSILRVIDEIGRGLPLPGDEFRHGSAAGGCRRCRFACNELSAIDHPAVRVESLQRGNGTDAVAELAVVVVLHDRRA